MKRESRAPLIVAIVLLLLPVLYVGSYLALVVPQRRLVAQRQPLNQRQPRNQGLPNLGFYYSHYRCDGQWAGKLFWPLEQIDRKMRPEAWETGKKPTRSERSPEIEELVREAIRRSPKQ